jgi:hypothetical protein
VLLLGVSVYARAAFANIVLLGNGQSYITKSAKRQFDMKVILNTAGIINIGSLVIEAVFVFGGDGGTKRGVNILTRATIDRSTLVNVNPCMRKILPRTVGWRVVGNMVVWGKNVQRFV